jgi:arylsulfatase A-like enzyme
MQTNPPNIILIIMDTAGAKHMSLYGYHRRTTPQLERLAEKATVFTRGFAPGSWTLPSHASLFTGLYPSEHWVDGDNIDSLVLSPRYQHLANILKQANYLTYAVTNSSLAVPAYGICRDFDVCLDYSKEGAVEAGLSASLDPEVRALYNHLLQPASKWHRVRHTLDYSWRKRDLKILSSIAKLFFFRHFNVGTYNYSSPSTKRCFRTAQKMIDKHCHKNTGRPFFFFINVIENHALYNPPKSFRQFSRKTDRHSLNPFKLFDEDYTEQLPSLLPIWKNLYDDSMLFLDSVIGQFLDYLKFRKLTENTVIIITSDHGEHFGEKGFYQHKFSLFNEILSIPLVISCPDGFSIPGNRDDRLVSLQDLFSTVLDLMDSPFPRPQHSLSLVSSERRKSVAAMNLKPVEQKIRLAAMFNKPREWAEDINFHRYAMILDNNIKLLEDDKGNVAIFHLASDPQEDHDLSHTLAPEVKQELLLLLKQDQQQVRYVPES